MYTWIIEALSKYASVIAYDRAGLGRSSPSGESPDGETRARELHDLMRVMDLKGPFILIGHSIAGLYLRIYVHRWPTNVLGLVFLDATHSSVYRLFRARIPLGERLRAGIAICASRLGTGGLPFPLIRSAEPPWNSLPAEVRLEIEHLSANPDFAFTQCAERRLLGSASRQADSYGDLGTLPLLVISGGMRTKRELRYESNPESFMEKWMLLQRDLGSLSTQGVHRIVDGAGHCDLITDKRHAAQVCAHIVNFHTQLSAGG